MWRISKPASGVKAGQTLRVPLSSSLFSEQKGRWKDGLFSCFRFGLFHPHVWTAWLCPQILLGQILTRMKMTWLAKPAGAKSTLQSVTSKIFLCLVMFSIYDAFVAPPMFEVTVAENGEVIFHHNIQQRWHQVYYVLLSLPMSLYGVLMVVKLRAAIRSKYGIPTGRLGRLEDCCYVCCCNCCVMSQLARQTADYDDVPAAWCSPNGMKRSSAMLTDDEDILPAISV